jgi:hypothetical protein
MCHWLRRARHPLALLRGAHFEHYPCDLQSIVLMLAPAVIWASACNQKGLKTTDTSLSRKQKAESKLWCKPGYLRQLLRSSIVFRRFDVLNGSIVSGLIVPQNRLSVP